MDGKVVQLIQGREKALEGGSPLEMLEKFRAFPQIQVIDLDAAMSKGSNDALVELLASRAIARVGGGVRSPARARAPVALVARGSANATLRAWAGYGSARCTSYPDTRRTSAPDSH